MNRREFIGTTATAAASVMLTSLARGQNKTITEPLATVQQPPKPSPRWRGFNLTELTDGKHGGEPYRETDFAWMQEWGFNFARLPLNYWTWSKREDWLKIDEAAFKHLDAVMELGRSHGVHLNVCLHRIPGYCVNGRELEPFQLFEGSADAQKRALDAAVHHWRFVAQRYKNIPASQLSFDLLNEPPFMPDHSRYVEIARTLIAALREISPERLIMVDGADIGQTPVMGLVDQGVMQCTRGYLPKMVSHYTATWVPKNEFESFEKPTWPMTDSRGIRWDREKLRTELIAKWQPLVDRGVPIHVGEWGCFTQTPHAACLGWMTDLLALWQEAGWGWSMWNLRGDFGILDSNRKDVRYEDFHGHKLDRQMLELLLAN